MPCNRQNPMQPHNLILIRCYWFHCVKVIFKYRQRTLARNSCELSCGFSTCRTEFNCNHIMARVCQSSGCRSRPCAQIQDRLRSCPAQAGFRFDAGFVNTCRLWICAPPYPCLGVKVSYPILRVSCLMKKRFHYSPHNHHQLLMNALWQ